MTSVSVAGGAVTDDQVTYFKSKSKKARTSSPSLTKQSSSSYQQLFMLKMSGLYYRCSTRNIHFGSNVLHYCRNSHELAINKP